MLLQPHTRLVQHVHSQFVWITVLVDDSFNPRVDQHFGTDSTRSSCTVEGCSSGRDAVKCSLDDGVGLRMHCSTELVTLSTWNPTLLS